MYLMNLKDTSIRNKGNYEQDRQFYFPSLYGNKAVTKNTKGRYKTKHRQLKTKI